MDQLILTFHGDSTHIAEHLIVIFIIYLKPYLNGSIRKTYVIQKSILYIRAFQFYRFPGNIANVEKLLHEHFDLGKDLAF